MDNNINSASKAGSSLIPTLFLGFVLTFGLFGCSGGGSDDKTIVPTVSLAADTIAEGDLGSIVNLEFTVTSSVAIDSDITLTYATSGGSATAGSDYTETSGTIDIPAGSTTATISVPVLGDADVEPDENFTLTLIAATGATLATASVEGTITNDDEDPNGYYGSGTAAVKSSDGIADLAIDDLQGMVSGNRFMLLSVSEALLYDGTVVITGNTYTASVSIYKNGALLPDAATASGTITTASSMTGTLTGVGAGNGTFSLTYSLNNAPSDLSRVDLVDGWVGPLNAENITVGFFAISNIGELSMSGNFINTTPVLAGCAISSGSTVLPISGINIYNVTLTLSNCSTSEVNGNYAGFATTQTVEDNILVLAFSNGLFSGSGTLLDSNL